jgi:hypothetical protein
MSAEPSHLRVRADFVPKSDYVSPEVARLENKLLWLPATARADDVAEKF